MVHTLPNPLSEPLPKLDTASERFTPGPWVQDGPDASAFSPESCVDITAPTGRGWAHFARVVVVCGAESDAEGIANARLITAAPDLYGALEMVRDADDDCKRDGLPTIPATARAKIDAALRKARGEQ